MSYVARDPKGHITAIYSSPTEGTTEQLSLTHPVGCAPSYLDRIRGGTHAVLKSSANGRNHLVNLG